MLTKNGSWRFFISFTLSHTADTSIVHFFLFDDDSFVPDYSSSRAFWHFFWIQFRLKLFLPSFFFPRITFIFFSCLIIISMVCVHNGTECFLSTKKENFLLVLLHIAHFFVCSRWIRHCIEAKKTKE